MLAMLTMSLVMSCGDDDKGGSGKTPTGDDLVKKATGTWICTESIDKKNGKTYDGLMVGNQLTINDDYTYWSTSQDFGLRGTYTVEGNKITATSDTGKTFVITVSVVANKMTWTGTSANNVTFNYTFQRVSQNSYVELGFTKDMIAGDFSWEVADYMIENGTNDNLKKGVTLRFKEDGTCTGFNSMENAWRIINGVIETYNKETNEPMFTYTLGSRQDDVLMVRMKGARNNFQALVVFNKVVEESSTIAVVDYWSNLGNLNQARAVCYERCVAFEHLQRQIEEARITGNSQLLTPYSGLITDAWQAAYNTIATANSILESVQVTSDESKQIIAEVRAIRAFVNYNLAMLWGDVPLVSTSNIGNLPSQSSQVAVYNSAYFEISSVLDNLSDNNLSGEGKLVFGRDAGRMLKTELEMALGKSQNALATLSQINKNRYEDNMTSEKGVFQKSAIWSMIVNETSAYYLIYTYDHIKFYEMELTGNTETAIDRWLSGPGYTRYGCWATLKRLGRAKNATGCQDYELLMPIPVSELQKNPYLKQNPGY